MFVFKVDSDINLLSKSQLTLEKEKVESALNGRVHGFIFLFAVHSIYILLLIVITLAGK